MKTALYLLGLLSHCWLCAAEFSLYPTVNPDSLASIIGVSASCLSALNETIACDATNFRRLKSVDYYLWSTDNITALCTAECQESAQSWASMVTDHCEIDTIEYMGKAVSAETISGRYVDGLGLACLTSSTNSMCMIESQNWIGSDMIYESDGSLSPSQPLTQLYENSTICSECFALVLQTRLNSPYTPDSQHTDYIAAEFSEIVSYCGLDNNTYSLSPSATYASYLAVNYTSTSAASSETAGVTSCAGQTIPTTALNDATGSRHRRQLLDDLTANSNVSAICESLAVEHQVTTGDLVVASGNNKCNFTSNLCLPQTCELLEVSEGETCASIASALSTSDTIVTGIQLQTWNPNIIGVCDNLLSGQYICVSPPGGAWSVAIASITATGDGGGISYTAGTFSTWATTPTPIQTGLIRNCDEFYLVVVNDTCYDIAVKYGISLDQFYAYNPAVGSECLNLWAADYVCVGLSSGEGVSSTSGSASITSTPTITSTTVTGTSPTTPVTTPTPTQAGMVSDCDTFYYVQSGDGCWTIANEYGISLDDFYVWNPAVNDDCSGLWPDYYVYVGIE